LLETTRWVGKRYLYILVPRSNKWGVILKYRLMDILACPYDKSFPLKLYIFKVNKYEDREVKFKKKPVCEIFCSFKNIYVKELKEEPKCEECIKYEVDSGLLYCEKCGRWYPIIDEIPILLPDELRNKEEDLEFLKKYRDKIPENIASGGKPWSLQS